MRESIASGAFRFQLEAELEAGLLPLAAFAAQKRKSEICRASGTQMRTKVEEKHVCIGLLTTFKLQIIKRL